VNITGTAILRLFWSNLIERDDDALCLMSAVKIATMNGKVTIKAQIAVPA
jgi:hypothetical protein